MLRNCPHSDGPLFAFSLFTPTIISQLGFKATAVNLLSVPVYAWACIMTVVVGFWGDRVKTRTWINLYVFCQYLMISVYLTV